MKIGFLTSYRAQTQYKKEHYDIISCIERLGHEVVHSMNVSIDTIVALPYIEREKVFMDYFRTLETCDLIIAECSLQSTHVGFGLAYLRERGKPVIILTLKESGGNYATSGDVYSEIENVYMVEYSPDTLRSVLDDAILYMSEKLDKRFTMIFPSQLMAQLEKVSSVKKLPKAVYIRQALEESLKKEHTD